MKIHKKMINLLTALVFSMSFTNSHASENPELWDSVKIFSMTFDADDEPEDLKMDATVLKTVALVKEQKPDILTVRGSKLRVNAFVELTRALDYNEGSGGSWSASDKIGGSWVSFHGSLKKKKSWNNLFGVIYHTAQSPQKYSIAFLNGSLSSNAMGQFSSLGVVRGCLENEVSCEHRNEDGSYLNFSPPIRIFTGRIGEEDGLLDQHDFGFKSMQLDYFKRHHVPAEGCTLSEHSTGIIRLHVSGGSMLLTRRDLVNRGWYCDDVFCAGLEDLAFIKTHIYPIFDSNEPVVWGGMIYQPLVQQPIISQLTWF